MMDTTAWTMEARTLMDTAAQVLVPNPGAAVTFFFFLQMYELFRATAANVICFI